MVASEKPRRDLTKDATPYSEPLTVLVVKRVSFEHRPLNGGICIFRKKRVS